MKRTFETLVVWAGHGGAQLAMSLAGAEYAGTSEELADPARPLKDYVLAGSKA